MNIEEVNKETRTLCVQAGYVKGAGATATWNKIDLYYYVIFNPLANKIISEIYTQHMGGTF